MKRKKKGLWGSVCEAQRTQTLSLYFLVLNFVHCVLRFALVAWFSCAAPPRTLSSPMPPPWEIGMALSRCNWHQLNKHMHTGFCKPVALSVIDVILAVKSSDQLGSVIKSLSGRLPERSPTGFFFFYPSRVELLPAQQSTMTGNVRSPVPPGRSSQLSPRDELKWRPTFLSSAASGSIRGISNPQRICKT